MVTTQNYLEYWIQFGSIPVQKYSHCEVLQGKWYQVVNNLCAHQFENVKFPTTHRIKNTRKTPEYYGGG